MPRLLAAAAVLYWKRDVWRELLPSFSWTAPLLGLAVFVVWVATDILITRPLLKLARAVRRWRRERGADVAELEQGPEAAIGDDPLATMEGETHGTDADAGEYLQQSDETLEDVTEQPSDE